MRTFSIFSSSGLSPSDWRSYVCYEGEGQLGVIPGVQVISWVHSHTLRSPSHARLHRAAAGVQGHKHTTRHASQACPCNAIRTGRESVRMRRPVSRGVRVRRVCAVRRGGGSDRYSYVSAPSAPVRGEASDPPLTAVTSVTRTSPSYAADRPPLTAPLTAYVTPGAALRGPP